MYLIGGLLAFGADYNPRRLFRQQHERLRSSHCTRFLIGCKSSLEMQSLMIERSLKVIWYHLTDEMQNPPMLERLYGREVARSGSVH